ATWAGLRRAFLGTSADPVAAGEDPRPQSFRRFDLVNREGDRSHGPGQPAGQLPAAWAALDVRPRRRVVGLLGGGQGVRSDAGSQLVVIVSEGPSGGLSSRRQTRRIPQP